MAYEPMKICTYFLAESSSFRRQVPDLVTVDLGGEER